MLQYTAVAPHTLRVLKQLMEVEELQEFYLGGDVALTLYYGHRKSVDIDLFSTTKFENETIIKILEENFKGFYYLDANNPTDLLVFIEGMKVNFCQLSSSRNNCGAAY